MNIDLATETVVDPIFDNVKDKDAMIGWLMRVYFNPQKHSDKNYYKATVSKENVLAFVSDAKNSFPQSPYCIVGMWNLMPSLRDGLRAVPSDAEAPKEDTYTKGNETLASIGKAIGGVTPTMVNKISDQATIRMGAMLKALNADNPWLVREAEDKIENAFLTVAETYADAIQKSAISGEVLEHVVNAGLLSMSDALGVDDVELDAIQELIEFAQEGATQAELEDVFLEDLEKSVNVFETVQLCVSKIVFPAKKRGRPRKDKSEETEYTDD